MHVEIGPAHFHAVCMHFLESLRYSRRGGPRLGPARTSGTASHARRWSTWRAVLPSRAAAKMKHFARPSCMRDNMGRLVSLINRFTTTEISFRTARRVLMTSCICEHADQSDRSNLNLYRCFPASCAERQIAACREDASDEGDGMGVFYLHCGRGK